jgi:hypothetical protein
MSKDINANFVDWNFCHRFQLNAMSAPASVALRNGSIGGLSNIQTY